MAYPIIRTIFGYKFSVLRFAKHKIMLMYMKLAQVCGSVNNI